VTLFSWLRGTHIPWPCVVTAVYAAGDVEMLGKVSESVCVCETCARACVCVCVCVCVNVCV